MLLTLATELLAMQSNDQTLLKKLIDCGELPENSYHPELKLLHQKHNNRIKEIIKEIGWPTISLVGKDASKAAWLIVQHAILDEPFMKRCLLLLKEAVDHDDAEAWCYAYLIDRTLTQQAKPQVYGTQFDVKNGEVIAFPIDDIASVDARRKQVGLDTLLEATRRIQKHYNL